jgi:hypothetical protein
MPTAAAKKPTGKPALARRAAAPRARLTPPPGIKAAKIADLLPPPSADFDAEAVERVIACRSDR